MSASRSRELVRALLSPRSLRRLDRQGDATTGANANELAGANELANY